MTLAHLFNVRRLLRCQDELITAQQKMIDMQTAELNRVHLEYTREMQGVVCAWLIGLESPEVDRREDLAEFEKALAHRIAVLEEHIL